MSRSSHWGRESAVPFQLLRQELQRLLEQYVRPAGFPEDEARPTDLESSSWSPPVDVSESPEEFVIAAEVPGVDPTSIDISAAGNVLTMKGAKPQPEPEEWQAHVRERAFGAFHRQIGLPNEVDFDKAEATIDHGVLRIRLPKRTAAKSRTIPIRPA